MNYIVRVLGLPDLQNETIFNYIIHVGKTETELYGNKFDWKKFPINEYLTYNRVTLCLRDDVPVGIMFSRLYPSIFDRSIKVLMQDVLFAEPGTRAAKLLLDDFIDFGKANANHVITMIAKKTNIKGKSLEKLGFTKMEELYRMEN